MTIEQIVIIAVAVLGIVGVYWFFLGKRTKKAVLVEGDAEIVVDGGYTPDTIAIPAGKTTTIHFLRKDPNPCLEEVIIGEFKIRRLLPLNERVDVQLTPPAPGTFRFTCGMGMYHGTIIVR